MLKRIARNTIVRLIAAIIIGLIGGSFLNENTIQVALSFKHILGQIIFFLIPLIVIGFVASSITKLSENNSSSVFAFSLLLAYFASMAAELFALVLGYAIIPKLSIPDEAASLREIPVLLFKLDIPPIFSVITALILAFMLGLGILWSKSKNLSTIVNEAREMVSVLIKRILIPIIPFFVGLTFAVLSYEGSIQKHLPVFGKVVLIVILMHVVWLFILYSIAAIVSKRNPIPLIKNYVPAYLTAMGTMSSMATLGVTIDCVNRSKVLKPALSNFTIPFFANIHLCGSVIALVFLTLGVSQVLYGQLPELGTMLLFIPLLGVFAVSAPGVPGGTVIASLGLITNLLFFDDAALALLLSIFALQDSFGTATNVVSDGALAMIVERHAPDETSNNGIHVLPGDIEQ